MTDPYEDFVVDYASQFSVSESTAVRHRILRQSLQTLGGLTDIARLRTMVEEKLGEPVTEFQIERDITFLRRQAEQERRDAE